MSSGPDITHRFNSCKIDTKIYFKYFMLLVPCDRVFNAKGN